MLGQAVILVMGTQLIILSQLVSPLVGSHSSYMHESRVHHSYVKWCGLRKSLAAKDTLQIASSFYHETSCSPPSSRKTMITSSTRSNRRFWWLSNTSCGYGTALEEKRTNETSSSVTALRSIAHYPALESSLSHRRLGEAGEWKLH